MHFSCISLPHMHFSCISLPHMHFSCISLPHMHFRLAKTDTLRLHAISSVSPVNCECRDENLLCDWLFFRYHCATIRINYLSIYKIVSLIYILIILSKVSGVNYDFPVCCVKREGADLKISSFWRFIWTFLTNMDQKGGGGALTQSSPL